MSIFNLFKKDKKKENITKGLEKTSSKFKDGLSRIFLGKKEINEELLEELEELLITSDMGATTSDMILEKVKKEYTRGVLKDSNLLIMAIKEILREVFNNVDVTANNNETTSSAPYVILISGVNGVGKTTTIAKLANMYKKAGKSVMVVAGDTFRAAAIDQLSIWAEKLSIPIVKSMEGGDAAAIIHDGIISAKAKNIDVLIIDTAGRLHTKNNLMQELIKINKVSEKALGHPINESLIIIDATNGQNAINQVKTFKDAININGVILTKLDGTAKGGIAFKLVHELGLPIKYIGFGEGIDDLSPFDATSFIDGIFGDRQDI